MQQLISKLKREQKGDTIVEVLVCMAIISAVLGTAYTAVNRSVKNSQQAQEHSQALLIAESQLELLSELNPTLGTNAFCMTGVVDPAADRMEVLPGSALTATSLPSAEAAYPPECQFGDNLLVGDRYRVGITKDGAATYKIHVAWEGATGRIDTVNLAYKVFNP